MSPSSQAQNLLNALVACISQSSSISLCRKSNKERCFFMNSQKKKKVLIHPSFCWIKTWSYYTLVILCSFRQAIWSKLCSSWADNSYKEHPAMLYGFPSQIPWETRELVSGISFALLFYNICEFSFKVSLSPGTRVRSTTSVWMI